MAAPVVASVGTSLTYTVRTSSPVPVPSGVTNKPTDIVVVFFWTDASSAVTAPLDFVETGGSPITNTTAGHVFTLRLFWRRPSAADSGTYTFTHASTQSTAVAVRISGCVDSGNPFNATNSAASTVGVTASPAVSVTTTGADRLLLWAAANWNSDTFSTLAGFTNNVETANGLAFQSKSQAAAGSSGSLSSTYSVSGSCSAWLGAMLPIISLRSTIVRQAAKRAAFY